MARKTLSFMVVHHQRDAKTPVSNHYTLAAAMKRLGLFRKKNPRNVYKVHQWSTVPYGRTPIGEWIPDEKREDGSYGPA